MPLNLTKKKVVIDFDSDTIRFMSNQCLILELPTCIIRKKSETPVLIDYGANALKRRDAILDTEQFIIPIKNGKIADFESAKLLFKVALRHILRLNIFCDIYVIITGGMPANDKQTIFDVISSIGYKNVYLIQRPAVMSHILTDMFHTNAFLYMDNDITELTLTLDNQFLNSYSINVSKSALNTIVRNKMQNDAKVIITNNITTDVVNQICSLYKTDCSTISITGKDTITNNDKSVEIKVKEFYPIVSKVYSNITNLLKAAMMDNDIKLTKLICSKTLVICGKGTNVLGFEEYIYHQVTIGCTNLKNNNFILQAADYLVTNNDVWTNQHVE